MMAVLVVAVVVMAVVVVVAHNALRKPHRDGDIRRNE